MLQSFEQKAYRFEKDEIQTLKTKKGRSDLLQYQTTPTQTGSTKERPKHEGSDKRARGLSPQLEKIAT